MRLKEKKKNDEKHDRRLTLAATFFSRLILNSHSNVFTM